MTTVLSKLRQCDEEFLRSGLNLDVIWCVITLAATLIGAHYVKDGILSEVGIAQIDLIVGIFHALLYLQAITLMVLAISYVSSIVFRLRTAITLLLPIIIYGCVWFVTEPDPVAPMYQYGAMITFISITFYKLKSVVQATLLLLKVEHSVRIPHSG